MANRSFKEGRQLTKLLDMVVSIGKTEPKIGSRLFLMLDFQRAFKERHGFLYWYWRMNEDRLAYLCTVLVNDKILERVIDGFGKTPERTRGYGIVLEKAREAAAGRLYQTKLSIRPAWLFIVDASVIIAGAAAGYQLYLTNGELKDANRTIENLQKQLKDGNESIELYQQKNGLLRDSIRLLNQPKSKN